MTVQQQVSESADASTRVLVVEDEDEIRERMVRILDFEGFEAIGAGTIADALRLSRDEHPDIVVSDILMPHGDGLDLVGVLRARKETRLIPVVMVTALSDRQWQRRFMELGVDDYITKPFTAEELVGAIRTQCKKLDWRKSATAQVMNTAGRYAFEGRTYDPILRTIHFDDHTDEVLTVSEARLLLFLLERPGQPVSRQEIFEAMKRQYSPLDRTVDVLVGRLRRKMRDTISGASLLQTVRSVGYMLDAKVERVAAD